LRRPEDLLKQILAFVFILIALPAVATTRFVSTTGSDANTPCDVNPCQHIQFAVNAAAPGDIITVAAGTYDEAVTVNKTLTVMGAQAGVDARTRSAAESIVTDSVSGRTQFNITASDVTIDGFTLQGETSAIQFGFAVLIGAGTSGTHILNNIIQNNIAGISLANSGASQLVIRHNLIQNNNNAGPVSGTGIYTDQFNDGGTMSNVLIDANAFSGNSNGDILLAPTSPAPSLTNITIQDNTSTNAGNVILLAGATNATIVRNVITNSVGSSILIASPSVNVTVASNLLSGGGSRGIRSFDIGAGGVNTGLLIHHNSITNFGADGIVIDPGTTPPTPVDAQNNWFGCNAGPGQPGCETVTGNIDADPWLVLTIAASPTTVPRTTTSSIDAALTQNSDGADTTLQGVVRDGLSIAFTSTGGTIAPTPVTMTSGHAAATFTATTVGPGSASATLHSQTVTVPITVTLAPTTTALGTSVNPSNFGQAVTFTATVTSGVAGTPSGTVTFTIDGVPGLTVPLNGAAQASFTTSSLSPGNHPVFATYNGDPTYATSTSPTVTQTVNSAPSTTTIGSSVNPSTGGQAVTFTATVTGGFAPPTGTVTFTVDGVAGLPVPLNGSGQATFTTSALAPGSHPVFATYNGDATYATSTSSTLTQLVNPAPSTTTVVSSVNPSAVGQAVTFTATVTSSFAGTPTGTVTFTIDGVAGSAIPLNGSAQASFTTSSLAVGNHPVFATYSGDATYATSTSSTLTQVVNSAASTTTIASSVNPSAAGQSVTFTATVTSGVPGTPTGTVTFTIDGVAGSPVTLDASAQASLTTSSLSPGSHSVFATYSGDGTYAGSTSSTLTQVVNPAPSTTTITASLTQSDFGVAVTFTATVTGGFGTPTGTVTFIVDGVPQSPIPLNGAGQASFTTSSLAIGGHTLTANYSGDATYAPSSSPSINETVTPVAAAPVPALSWPMLLLLAAVLSAAGVVLLRR